MIYTSDKLENLRLQFKGHLSKGIPADALLNDLLSSVSSKRFAELAGIPAESVNLAKNNISDREAANILLDALDLKLINGEVVDTRALAHNQSVIIIDDFYSDPVAVRNFALSHDYQKRDRKDGSERRSLNSPKPFRPEEADQKLRHFLGCRFKHQESSGMFRLSPSVGVRTGLHIHVDVFGWNGICYLNLAEHCQGGTTLFRHKKTGIERGPTPFELENRPDIVERYESIKNDFRDDKKWEINMHIPMRFNRLVLIRGNMLHSRSSHFGESKEEARLTQVFFLQTPDS